MGRPKVLISEQAVIDSYMEGESINSMRLRMKTSQLRLRDILLNAGIEIKHPRGGFPAKRLPVRDMARDYRQGMSIVAVARKYKSKPTTVRSRLVKYGVEIRSKGEANTIDLPHAKISQLYQDGARSSELANIYGVSIPTIQRSLWNTNTPMRPSGRARKHALNRKSEIVVERHHIPRIPGLVQRRGANERAQ